MQNKKLNEAISSLARYIPYGELMASTDVENNYICVPDSSYPAKHIVDRLCGKV